MWPTVPSAVVWRRHMTRRFQHQVRVASVGEKMFEMSFELYLDALVSEQGTD